MNKNQLIYLASPYSHNDQTMRKYRYDKVVDLTAKLLNQGYHVISPVVHCHPLAVKHNIATDFTFWKSYNYAILSKCNLLVVYKLKGWEKSEGLQGELEMARNLKLPIEFIND